MCSLPAARHKVQHIPDGESSCSCGALWERHKVVKNDKEKDYYVGIDGEGQGRQDHRYVLLAWSNASGSRRDHIEAKPGERLTTVQCLEFILSLPLHAKPFAFAFNYDLTKILVDLDNRSLYYLFRPEPRQRKPGYQKFGPHPVIWNGYALNLQGTKFSVRKGKKLRVIWDVFKFYQASFVKALTLWFERDREWSESIKADVDRMALMKSKRAEFDKEDAEAVRAYCYKECEYMAKLVRKLVQAHDRAGLHLRNFYGAGSTATVMLKQLGIGEHPRKTPEGMELAVASSFFGGRFENSVIGIVEGEIWGYDVSNAYPYQITALPCLACGRWSMTRDRDEMLAARAAVVRYTMTGKLPPDEWAPFPFRLTSGSICFPATSGGGWVWREEYLQGEKLFPQVGFKQAWIYTCSCTHQPFARMPQWYLERLRLGKEGAGIAIKNGCNSVYGKSAQSIGSNPPFQCWIWAAMTTSGCRAQLLELYGLHKDRRNMIMTATDGIYSLEKLETPLPRETGTGPEFARNEFGEPIHKPLGGWERKIMRNGMFAARPGIYFPLSESEEIKEIRARGIGRSTLRENQGRIVEGWKAGLTEVRLDNVTRFHGAKTSISQAGKADALQFNRSPLFGQWRERQMKLDFDPLPKRSRINDDRRTLKLRTFGPDVVSAPYSRAIVSEETMGMRLALMEILEQPDGEDFIDYTDLEEGTSND
jgi:hypothetical protein